MVIQKASKVLVIPNWPQEVLSNGHTKLSIRSLNSWSYNIFFNSVLRPFQDYFSSYETGQSVGGAKTGEPREKTPGTPARTWLVSHVAGAGLKPTPDKAVR